MAEQQDWRKPYFEMISRCKYNEDSLNDWENEFIESVGERLTANKPLTQKQIETLEKLNDKVSR